MPRPKLILVTCAYLHMNFGCILKIVGALRKSQRDGRMKSYDARLEQLQTVYRMVKENEEEIAEALMKDLHKVY